MATQAKFTFKLHKKATGLAAVGHGNQGADIKFNKKVVGSITAPNWNKKQYSAGFMVKKSAEEFAVSPNCDWKWIFLKVKTDTLEEMKEKLNASIDMLLEKFVFHELDSEEI